jgi:hypothetical protein
MCIKQVWISHHRNEALRGVVAMTTAIYSNRVRDKEVLERFMSLPEDGSEDIELWIPSGPMFSKGYERIVYGDHGPYIEYQRKHILLGLFSKKGIRNEGRLYLPELPDPDKCQIYYISLCPVDGDQIFKYLKVYWQIRPVSDKPNAPRREDGEPSCFNRAEGYADYKRGMYYISPYALQRK